MEKIVYLTVDDGPNKGTPTTLKILNDRHIPALWFFVGRHIRQRSGDVKAVLEAGHLIGNHSFSHALFSDIPLVQGLDEIRLTDTMLDRLGVKHKFFRYPGGVCGPHGVNHYQLLTDLGYHQVFQDVSYPSNPLAIRWTANFSAKQGFHGPLVQNLLNNPDSDIILSHSRDNPSHLSDFLDQLLAQGVRFQLPPLCIPVL